MRVFTPKAADKLKVKALGKTDLFAGKSSNGHLERLRLLAQAAHEHPWTFATVDAVTRSVIGAGWKFVQVERYKGSATKRQLKILEDFFNYSERQYNNIKDFQSLPDKIGQIISAYRLTGHTALEIVRDGTGKPVGFDVLSGITLPQIDAQGWLKDPAFLYYPWNSSDPVEYRADEIVYIYNSGVTGDINGESAYEALMNTSLPSDIFAAVSYRSLFENANSPYNGVWVIDPGVSDEDLEYFERLLIDRYSGVSNYGRNPLMIRGGVDFKTVKSRGDEDAPYLDGRTFNRQEFYGVTGVDGNKLGISGDANKANMRETRREFHENVLRPLFRKLESDIYNQIIVRVLGIKGWMFQFNQPDITNALEQATIDMRYMQWGVYSPNEIRAKHGEQPREGGDYYLVPTNMIRTGDDYDDLEQDPGSQGSQDNSNDNSNGEEPDDGSGSTENINDPVRPPRDEETESNSNLSSAITELRNWKKIQLEQMDGKRSKKAFVSLYVRDADKREIQNTIDSCQGDFNVVKSVFNEIIKRYEVENGN